MAEPNSSEKTAMQSKKFRAWIISELGWKTLAFAVLIWGKDMIPGATFGVLITIILVSGFLQVLYIGGQAALDRYLILADKVTDVATGVMDGEPKPAKKPTPTKVKKP